MNRTDRTPIRAAAIAAMAARRGNPELFTFYSQRLAGARRRAFADAYYQRMPAPAVEVPPAPDAQAALGAAMKNGGHL